jgi:hypothetical protein
MTAHYCRRHLLSKAEWPVFAKEGTVGVGALRRVTPQALFVHIEAHGEVPVSANQIARAHDRENR